VLLLGKQSSNDLIIRDIYALSSNDETKLADWVASRLDKETVTGEVDTPRIWNADPWLAADTLSDFRGLGERLKGLLEQRGL
jgi:endonuclease G